MCVCLFVCQFVVDLLYFLPMDSEELPFLFPSVIFLFFLLFAVTPVHGQPRVIGSTQPIRASPGDDVILPCHVEPPVDVVRLTVEWSKPDLQPDPDDRLGDVGYVHLYRDRHEVLDMKIPSYARRTELLPDDLRRGNISLRMMNVSLEDGGRYRCFIPKLSKSRVRSSIIHLVVEPPSLQTTETPLLSVTLHTPDLHGDTNVRGAGASSRSRVITAGVFIALLMMLMGVGVKGSLAERCQKRDVTEVPSV
ncbi:myelin-oligodendrocyte glycoprotein-like [Labrus bergylta]|uniref:myelin-oligodendrocyte glycoprotein-like n=1 Tax=Labrus bergylta TaxID=56723 RepID=UPI003313CD4C